MRKLFLFVAALFLAFNAFSKGPQIKFETRVIDVGRIPINTKAVGEFRFKNVGDEKLIIFMVKPG